jgi:hypothetical protein
VCTTPIGAEGMRSSDHLLSHWGGECSVTSDWGGEWSATTSDQFITSAIQLYNDEHLWVIFLSFFSFLTK